MYVFTYPTVVSKRLKCIPRIGQKYLDTLDDWMWTGVLEWIG